VLRWVPGLRTGQRPVHGSAASVGCRTVSDAGPPDGDRR